MHNAVTALLWAIAIGMMFLVGTTIIRCFVALADAIADGMDERERKNKVAAYELEKKRKQDAEAEAWRAKNPHEAAKWANLRLTRPDG